MTISFLNLLNRNSVFFIELVKSHKDEKVTGYTNDQPVDSGRIVQQNVPDEYG
jgi:hypothetical protein